MTPSSLWHGFKIDARSKWRAMASSPRWGRRVFPSETRGIFSHDRGRRFWHDARALLFLLHEASQFPPARLQTRKEPENFKVGLPDPPAVRLQRPLTTTSLDNEVHASTAWEAHATMRMRGLRRRNLARGATGRGRPGTPPAYASTLAAMAP